MKFAFRADASLEIGSGHVMRCLALAEALRQKGEDCHFICRGLPGNQIAKIRSIGFPVTRLPIDIARLVRAPSMESRLKHASWLGVDWRTDSDATRAALQLLQPDWLVVDHYALDYAWESEVRGACGHLMVIDDLADRSHDCDLLLDQTFGRAVDEYASLVPKSCRVLAGARYALMRPEFADLREYSMRRRESPELRRLLIAMGGVDRSNATGKVLDAIPKCRLPHGCSVVVMMGANAPWVDRVRVQTKTMPWPCEVKVDVTNVAELMADSDMAIGAPGGSAWERCVLGVPSIMVVTARNQRDVASSLERAGAARVIGDVESIEEDLPRVLAETGKRELARMTCVSAGICDGRGTARVTDALRYWGVQIRRMRESDLENVLQWRNYPDIRHWMYNSHEISSTEHRKWYARAMQDRHLHLLIVEEAGVPLGFVQFAGMEHDGVADWGFYTVPGAPSGSGRKLGTVALNYAFEKIGLRKVYGEAVAWNRQSVEFHRKLGFLVEGILPKRFFDGETQHNVLRFGLEANKWYQRT